MAKVYTGRDGKMFVDNGLAVKVSSFSVQANLETLEATTLGDYFRDFVPGVVGYSGTASLLYYKDDFGLINTRNILDRLYFKTSTTKLGVTEDDKVTFIFRLLDGADRNDIKLHAYITSASIGVSTGEIVRAEVSFQGLGDLKTVSINGEKIAAS
jgi:hypothetical protein